ncbi:unnamed protein product [Blepharisma stoltei]|uniref:DoxX family protein n=1 Tax=Blepharisma stoltei TaxID=1481888 RepID=A0AAU9IKP5_9CILI|nr:unnamed protein product [Blepharisma stoltei]
MGFLKVCIRSLIVFYFIVTSLMILNNSASWTSGFVSGYNQVHFHIKLVTGITFPNLTTVIQNYPETCLTIVGALGLVLSFLTVLNNNVGTLGLLLFTMLKATPKFYHIQDISAASLNVSGDLLLIGALFMILLDEEYARYAEIESATQKIDKKRE